jgi:hypothetical protein
MTVKDRTYVLSGAYSSVGEPHRKVAVVYYSTLRRGHIYWQKTREGLLRKFA